MTELNFLYIPKYFLYITPTKLRLVCVWVFINNKQIKYISMPQSREEIREYRREYWRLNRERLNAQQRQKNYEKKIKQQYPKGKPKIKEEEDPFTLVIYI